MGTQCNRFFYDCREPEPAGGRCGEAGDCQPGLGCSLDTLACGSKAAGDLCFVPENCLPGLECVWSSRRDEQICLAPGTFEYPCDYRDSGPCKEGLVCTSFGWCAEPEKHGGPCGDNLDCAQGLVCDRYDWRYECADPIAEGQPCAGDADEPQCAEGLICRLAMPTPTCGPPGAEGQSCLADRDCAAGLVCNLAFAPPACASPGLAGTACAADTDCAEGLTCDPYHEPWICAGPGGDGERCGLFRACADGLSCNAGLEPPECRPPQPANQPCGWTDDCLDGLACDHEAKKCGPQAQEDEPCWWPQDCAAGARCDYSSQPPRCVAAGAAGEPCAGGACEPGLVCDQSNASQVCKVGQECLHNVDCTGDTDLVCNWAFYFCMPPGEAGTPCGYWNDCADGLICDCLHWDPARCWPPPAAGEPCIFTCWTGPWGYYNAVCADGLACVSGGAVPVCAGASPTGE